MKYLMLCLVATLVACSVGIQDSLPLNADDVRNDKLIVFAELTPVDQQIEPVPEFTDEDGQKIDPKDPWTIRREESSGSELAYETLRDENGFIVLESSNEPARYSLRVNVFADWVCKGTDMPLGERLQLTCTDHSNETTVDIENTLDMDALPSPPEDLRCPKTTGSKFLGHRAGGGVDEIHCWLPENTLLSLKVALQGWKGQTPIQTYEKFKALEFDVRETFDGHLVVVHDNKLTNRLLWEGSPQNKAVMIRLKPILKERKRRGEIRTKTFKVENLKLEELKEFIIGETELIHSYQQRIPTLKEFLQAAAEFGVRRRVYPDLKNLKTDDAREEFFNLLVAFKRDYMDDPEIEFPDESERGMRILGKKSNLRESFGSDDAVDWWEQRFMDEGFGSFKHYF